MNKASSSGKPSRPLALAFFPANPNRGNGVLLRISLTHSLSLIARSVSHLSVLVNSTDAVLAAIASVLKVLHCDPETYGAGGLTWQQAVAAHEGQGAAPEGQGAGRGSTDWCDYTRSREMTRYQCQDIIGAVCEHFTELEGDGRIGADGCIRGGLAVIDGVRCVVVASFKGHTPSDMQAANYGMSSPHGYRKARRLMEIANRFGVPLVTLIDTCGALPSFDAETHGQSEAIASNLTTMSSLKVPIVSLVVGEGGSGGALGIGMGNVVGMLSSAYYGVISPEGAASILGRYKDDAHKAAQFPLDCKKLAETQRIYAPQLLELGVIDEVIYEAGDREGEGAESKETHEDFPRLTRDIRAFVRKSLESLAAMDEAELVAHRYQKFRAMGKFDTVAPAERDAIVAAAKEAVANAPPRARPAKMDRTPSRILQFIAETAVNGDNSKYRGLAPATLAHHESQHLAFAGEAPALSAVTSGVARPATTAKAVLDAEGPEAMAAWVRSESASRQFITDTTMRDAHQSLLATRMRTIDLLGAAEEADRVLGAHAFSFECWGGATFDVCHRFLHESPWMRLKELRKAVPGVLFQMLIRGSNAVGYKSYPDNVVVKFVEVAADAGVDVFRIFDCFNNLEQMRVCIDAVRAVKKVAEVCICFTGDFLSADEKIYTLDYYRDLARNISASGAHMIAIKDMAGLVKPNHAVPLLEAIRSVSDLPVHFHTHSTSGVSLATAMALNTAGCDVIDFAIASMSENTSQPNLNAFSAATATSARPTGIDYMDLERLDTYWSRTRELYAPFENGMMSSSAKVFEHQIPGGQYSNLMVQCKSMGLWSRWNDVLDMYRDVNRLFGDVVKVTPSSKCVGDMSLYLINRKMTAAEVLTDGDNVEFPASVVDLFAGRLSFPHHGFPKQLQDIVLKGEAPLTERPGLSLAPHDFDAERDMLASEEREAAAGGEEKKEGGDASSVTVEDVITSVLYPKVSCDFRGFIRDNGELWSLPTEVFWYGMEVGETVAVSAAYLGEGMVEDLVGGPAEAGATEVELKLVRVGPIKKGNRDLVFSVNGTMRAITVKDTVSGSASGGDSCGAQADPDDDCQLPSPLPGTVEVVEVAVGDKVAQGECLGIVCAMKMEVKVTAPFDLKVESVECAKGDRTDEGTLLFRVSKA